MSAKKKNQASKPAHDDASSTGEASSAATEPEESGEHDTGATEAVKVHHDSAHTDGAAHDSHGHHAPNRKEYWKVFFLLFALTVLEVGVAYLEKQIGKTPVVTALVGLALGKAAVVALFYMHLKHESKWMRWTVAIPLAFPALYAFILIAEGMYRALWRPLALAAGGHG